MRASHAPLPIPGRRRAYVDGSVQGRNIFGVPLVPEGRVASTLHEIVYLLPKSLWIML